MTVERYQVLESSPIWSAKLELNPIKVAVYHFFTQLDCRQTVVLSEIFMLDHWKISLVCRPSLQIPESLVR